MKILKCNWAVAYKFDKATQDDGIAKIGIAATFSHPANAEDFITKCLPEETKDNFFIITVDELENCENADRIQKVTKLYAKII